MSKKKEPKMYTLLEASRALGIPKITLRKAAERGNLKAKRIGKFWIVTDEALQEWQSKRQGSKF